MKKTIEILLVLACFFTFYLAAVYGQPPDHAGPPDHVWDKIPEHARPAVESIIALRGNSKAQRDVAYLNRININIMNPVWAEQEEVDEAEVEAIIEASSDRLAEEVAPVPLVLTDIDIQVLELIDIQTLTLMLQELTLAEVAILPVEVIELMLSELAISDLKTLDVNVLELMLSELDMQDIREIFMPKFDEMTASEEMFWLLSSKRISISLTPDFAEMEVKPQATLTEFIAVDYDDAVAKGGVVAVLDGAEIDLLAFQRQVTSDTRLIVLNHVDGNLTNYFYKTLTMDDYKRIATRIRSRRNMMNQFFPEIPTAAMVVVGRGDSDLLLLDLLDFDVDYLLLHGLSNPYAQWDAVARRYEKYGVKIIAGSVNEIRGLPTGGEEWQYIYDYMKQDDRYAGFLWRNPETPGGQKRVETHKR